MNPEDNVAYFYSNIAAALNISSAMPRFSAGGCFLPEKKSGYLMATVPNKRLREELHPIRNAVHEFVFQLAKCIRDIHKLSAKCSKSPRSVKHS